MPCPDKQKLSGRRRSGLPFTVYLLTKRRKRRLLAETETKKFSLVCVFLPALPRLPHRPSVKLFWAVGKSSVPQNSARGSPVMLFLRPPCGKKFLGTDRSPLQALTKVSSGLWDPGRTKPHQLLVLHVQRKTRLELEVKARGTFCSEAAWN